MRKSRIGWIAVATASLVILPMCATARPQAASDVAQLLSQGDAFAARKDLGHAMDTYKKADKASHHSCAECDLRMFTIEREAGDFDAALEDAKQALKAAGSDSQTAAEAHLVRGALLSSLTNKPGDKKLKQAEDDFRAALSLNPAALTARYDLGVDLLKQERNPDGIAALNAYIAAAGADPRLITQARQMIADPIRAREPFAPDFSFSAVDGSSISTAALRGRVVLLDFWGTWCPPCRESVPSLVSLQKKYAGREVEFIGISSDSDEDAWKSFVSAHRMEWPQYLDVSGSVRELFDVHEYPTYMILDRDGVIRLRQAGFDATTDMLLEDAIKKALKRPMSSAPLTAPAAH